MSAPHDVPVTDLRTLERDWAFSADLRTWGLKERWLSRWMPRNLVEGEVEGMII